MTRIPDRRASQRFALKMNLRFTVFKDRKPVSTGSGTVRNLSKTGILFGTDTFIRHGSVLHLAVDWPLVPSQQAPQAARVEWQVDAVCVRSSRRTAAVRIMRQRLVRVAAGRPEKVMASGAGQERSPRQVGSQSDKQT